MYSAILIVRVIFFNPVVLDEFLLIALFDIITFMLFLVYSILVVARSNFFLKRTHFHILHDYTKQLNQQQQGILFYFRYTINIFLKMFGIAIKFALVRITGKERMHKRGVQIRVPEMALPLVAYFLFICNYLNFL